MFGSGKRAEAKRLIATIQSDGKRIRAHLAAQALFAMDHLGLSALALWDEPYTRGYVFGAFDALLTEVPEAMRETTAQEMIESGYIQFITNAFATGEREARDGFADVARRQQTIAFRHAIADGRSDGLQMRQGLPATLWLAHIVETRARNKPT